MGYQFADLRKIMYIGKLLDTSWRKCTERDTLCDVNWRELGSMKMAASAEDGWKRDVSSAAAISTHLSFQGYLLGYLQPAVQKKSFNLPAGYP